MHSTHKSDSPPPPRVGIMGWLNRRTGLDDLLRSALDEPIPGGARFAYIFGSGLLFIFISQVITGVFLALYYVPSADHAHTTVCLYNEGGYGWIVSPQPARLRRQRDGRRLVPAPVANLHLRIVQRTARTSLALWMRALRSGPGNGVHRLPAPVGPASLFCHRRRNQRGQRSSLDW